ncbi:MAG: response regulator [Pseudomonadota bacterium]
MIKNEFGIIRRNQAYILIGIITISLLIASLFILRIGSEHQHILEQYRNQLWSFVEAERRLNQSTILFYDHLTQPTVYPHETVIQSFQNYRRQIDVLLELSNDTRFIPPAMLERYTEEIKLTTNEIYGLLEDPQLYQNNTNIIFKRFQRLEGLFSNLTTRALSYEFSVTDTYNINQNRQALYLALMVMFLCVLGMIQLLRQQRRKLDSVTLKFFESQKLEALGQLAGGIAHDFNNTLAAIQGYADFLINDLEDRKEQQKFALNISAATLDAKKLIEQILAYSRKTNVKHEPLNLTDQVENLSSFAHSTIRAGIEFDFAAPKDKDFYINGNSTQLGQVLINLCVNASDAIDHDAGRIELRLKKLSPDADEVRQLRQNDETRPQYIKSGDRTKLLIGFLKDKQDYICISISDNGSGIDPKDLSRIFDPFFSTKEVDLGTGLGLSAVLGIISEHQGAIIVETGANTGTSFRLFFPRIEYKESEASPQRSKVEMIAETKRVILVEDNISVGNMTAGLLERLGCEVLHCINGYEAVTLLKEGEFIPDLIITDYKMPKMTGLELARKLHKMHPEIPIILFTGYTGVSAEILATEEAIRDVIDKPATPQQFAEILKKYT